MANEKKVIVTGFNELAPATQGEWESNGWTVEHEISPVVKEFANSGIKGVANFDPITTVAFVTSESFALAGSLLAVMDGDDANL